MNHLILTICKSQSKNQRESTTSVFQVKSRHCFRCVARFMAGRPGIPLRLLAWGLPTVALSRPLYPIAVVAAILCVRVFRAATSRTKTKIKMKPMEASQIPKWRGGYRNIRHKYTLELCPSCREVRTSTAGPAALSTGTTCNLKSTNSLNRWGQAAFWILMYTTKDKDL